jgi:hypothetical protein
LALKPACLEEKSVRTHRKTLTGVEDKRRMVRSQTGLGREGAQREDRFKGGGHKHTIKGGPDRIELMVRPGKPCTRARYLPQGPGSNGVVEKVNQRPIEIVITLIFSGSDEVEIASHKDRQIAPSDLVRYLVQEPPGASVICGSIDTNNLHLLVGNTMENR